CTGYRERRAMARFGRVASSEGGPSRGDGNRFSRGEGGGAGAGGMLGHIQRRTARPTKPAWPTLKRAATLLGPHRITVILYLVTVIITSITGLFQPLLLQPIVDKAIPRHDVQRLVTLCAEMLVLVLASSLVGVLRSYLSNRIGQDVVYDLRVGLYRHLSG